MAKKDFYAHRRKQIDKRCYACGVTQGHIIGNDNLRDLLERNKRSWKKAKPEEIIALLELHLCEWDDWIDRQMNNPDFH